MIRSSNAKEDEVRRRLRSYMALVSEYNARRDLYITLFPRTTSEIRDMPAGGQSIPEIERIVDQRIDLRAQMDRSLQAMRDQIDDIMKLIEGLPAVEAAVLIRRYALGKSYEIIAKEINYSERQVFNIHDRAITRIAERLQSIAVEKKL